MAGERGGKELRLHRLGAAERGLGRRPLGRVAFDPPGPRDIDRARPRLRHRHLALANHDAGHADRHPVLAERTAVPFSQVGVRPLQRAQQAAGERERLPAEKRRDGIGCGLAELRRALVDGVREHEQPHRLVAVRPLALDKPRPVLAHFAGDNRVASDPDAHTRQPIRERETGNMPGIRWQSHCARNVAPGCVPKRLEEHDTGCPPASAIAAGGAWRRGPLSGHRIDAMRLGSRR